MPPRKHPEPFWRKQTNCYYVQIGARQHRLAADRDEAYRLYHELMSRPPEERQVPARSGDQLVVQIVDDFLEWVQRDRAPDTYDVYSRLLQIFAGSLPKSLAVSGLKPYHVTRVMDAHSAAWSRNTKHDFATTVTRALNWALKQGRIDKNPLAHVEKPPREARETAVSPADYAEVMAKVEEPNFRDLLALAWETGGRPQELRAIEARHVDFESWRIVFPPQEAKGKKSHRVIYLGTDRAREIARRLCDERPQGPLLLNSAGSPWTKDAINCAFVRLKKKLGRKLHLGAWRKGFATEALKNGVDAVTLAHLMGHANPAIDLARVRAGAARSAVHGPGGEAGERNQGNFRWRSRNGREAAGETAFGSAPER